MGKITGFMDYSRELAPRRPVAERVNDWFEIYQDFPEDKLRQQGARCMDCGVPFCQTGCPVNNHLPTCIIASIAAVGRKPSASCTLPTTFPNSPAASALRPAKLLVCWPSINLR